MTTRPADTRRLAAALRYGRLGWRVLALHTPTASGCSCGEPDCSSAGKHPRTPRGIDDATSDPSRIARAWTRWPAANIGILTGPQLIVVDVDGDAGRMGLAELERCHGPLPPTLTAGTGRGEHRYFTGPPDAAIANSAGRLAPGVDVRGHRGYVVAPPSLHPAGRRYRWTNQRRPAALPAWVAEQLAAPERHTAPPTPRAGGADRYLAAALDGELHELAAAPEGQRNTTLNRAAFRLGQLIGTGHGDAGTVAAALQDAALRTGLTETETTATIASGLHAGRQHPR